MLLSTMACSPARTVFIASPIAAMATIAAYIAGKWNVWVAARTANPKPLLAPNISAATTAIQPVPIPMRTPVRMDPIDSGSSTCCTSDSLLEPSSSAASRTSLSTELIPCRVDRKIDGHAAHRMIELLLTMPSPRSRMVTGKIARAETFRRASATGTIVCFTRLDWEAKTPAPTPRTTAATKPARTTFKLDRASGRREASRSAGAT